MSGSGAPQAVIPKVADAQIAIVAGLWHEEIMAGLIAGAQRACDEAGVKHVLIRVPGAFELPLVAANYAANHDAVVALGVIIRGGTPHFDYVCQAATNGLTRVALDSGTPVGFGLLTCDDEEQALARAGLPDSIEDKGREAASAALSTLVLLRAAAAPRDGLGFA